jgi:hypothetical protein
MSLAQRWLWCLRWSLSRSVAGYPPTTGALFSRCHRPSANYLRWRGHPGNLKRRTTQLGECGQLGVHLMGLGRRTGRPAGVATARPPLAVDCVDHAAARCVQRVPHFAKRGGRSGTDRIVGVVAPVVLHEVNSPCRERVPAVHGAASVPPAKPHGPGLRPARVDRLVAPAAVLKAANHRCVPIRVRSHGRFEN